VSEEVDQARERCSLLLRILTAAKDRAMSDPLGNYCVGLGIVQPGDKPTSAIRKVNRAFEELDGLLAHITLIDMTASLERAFINQLSTALGEAGKTLREKYGLQILHSVREGLVAKIGQFQGLRGLETLLGPQLAEELKQTLKAIRDDRNKFAHGTDVSQPPAVDIDDAHKALKAVAEKFNEREPV
jgi:hypothetical protein